MLNKLSYLWMSIGVLLLQVFLLDQLSIAMWLRPMIFPIVVLLLPMEWPKIWVMAVSLAVGLTIDLSLGGAGLYTATLLPLSLIRPWVLYVTVGRSVEHGDQTALFRRMRLQQLMIYVAAMLLIHHTLFFALETLSWSHPFQLIATILCSMLLSLVIVWPIVRLFTSKIVG